jgi:LuxR family transcriptional regulator, maltose regulon positive regulatory protein
MQNFRNKNHKETCQADEVVAEIVKYSNQLLPSVAEPLRLCTLGKLEVWLGGQLVQFPFARCGELVVWLVLHGPAGRDKIVDALWDGSRTPSHLEYFRVVVRRTRAALVAAGGLSFNPLVYQGGVYRLAPTLTVASDVALLENALATPTVERLRAALASYCGEFLPHHDREWAALLRTKLLDEALDVGLRLGQLLEPEQPRAALAVYRRLVALDPLLEGGHAGAIRLYQRLDEPVAAQSARVAARKALLE